ncbi:type IV secretion system protein [Cronobacter sakazakii]|nr:type IV secretion system protein [Cronobacter sakazakii]
MNLNNANFRDLYIGNGFTEFRGLIGASEIQAPALPDYIEDIENIRAHCSAIVASTGKTQFSLTYDTRLYRVTVLNGIEGNQTYVIRQTPSLIYDVKAIGISTSLLEVFRNPIMSGLVLISGGLGEGKTSTAAAILSDRIKHTGSLAVSVEDPIETLLEGRHGPGRCIQLEVGEYEGYSSALKKSMRLGASDMLIGEIRDSETAHEALKASMNGMFVIATIHSKSIVDAIERMIIFCMEKNTEARSILSKSIKVVMNQKMIVTAKDEKIVKRVPNIQGYCLDNDINGNAIASKIASGNTSSLESEFDVLRKNKMKTGGAI